MIAAAELKNTSMLRPRRWNMTNKYWVIGKVAIVDVSTNRAPRKTMLLDLDDVPFVIDGEGKWFAAPDHGTFYARRKMAYQTKMQNLGRLLLGLASSPLIADHKNGDGLDNRRKNLRSVTYCQNQMNRVKRGVSFRKDRGTWRVQFNANKKCHYLGTYPTEEEARRVYDDAIQKHHGIFLRMQP